MVATGGSYSYRNHQQLCGIQHGTDSEDEQEVQRCAAPCHTSSLASPLPTRQHGWHFRCTCSWMDSIIALECTTELWTLELHQHARHSSSCTTSSHKECKTRKTCKSIYHMQDGYQQFL